MARYLLFAGHNYYPRGGWNDFKSSFDGFRSALAEYRRLDRAGQESISGEGLDWFQVVDTKTGAHYDKEGWHQPGEVS